METFVVLLIVAVIGYLIYKICRDKSKQEHALAVADARNELFDELDFVPERDMVLNSCMTIWFDNDSNRIALSVPDDRIMVIDYGVILGHELKEKDRTSYRGDMDSALGGAVVGKALFDNATAGAIVGAAGTTFEGESRCSSLFLALKFDDMKTPYLEIPLLERDVDCNSAEYMDVRSRAGELSALFDLVQRRRKKCKLSGGKMVSYRCAKQNAD